MNNHIAKRSDVISDEMWQEVNEFNSQMVQEYLNDQAELSTKTKIAYTSGLRIFFYWVKEHLNNKRCIEIKKKEFVKYLNWLTNRGMSESAIKFKKSCVSAFCNYILMMYEEEYPTFRPFVTSEMKVVKTGNVFDKEPLTPDEFTYLCKELKERKEYQKLAYVQFSYSTGCRRAEARQLLKEVVLYPANEKEIIIFDENGKETKVISKSYLTHKIRCKGASVVGKVRRLKFGEETMQSLKDWLSTRGDDDCPYMFVTKRGKEISQVGEGTFNEWCSGIFTDIVGRRVHPHLLRESRATNIVVYEHKSSKVAQKLLGHNDVSTTENHYIIRSDETDESDEAFI